MSFFELVEVEAGAAAKTKASTKLAQGFGVGF